MDDRQQADVGKTDEQGERREGSGVYIPQGEVKEGRWIYNKRRRTTKGWVAYRTRRDVYRRKRGGRNIYSQKMRKKTSLITTMYADRIILVYHREDSGKTGGGREGCASFGGFMRNSAAMHK